MAENESASEPQSPLRGFHVDPRFINLKPVGHGGSGVVYSAMDSDCDKEVAIKKLNFCDKRSCKYALREVKIMRRLQHENVVTVYEVLGMNGYSIEKGGNVSANINEMSSIYIVQELLHTDLHQLILSEQLTDDHVRLFLYQLLRGLKYIHSANVLHRDLKPCNLLINVEDLVLKISDFGLARIIDDEYSHKGYLTDNVGTCWYRSPELIISPRDYSKAIDMWSVGCILGEMLTGKTLFPGAHEMDQIGQILDATCLSDNEWNKITQILPQNFAKKHSRVPKHPLKERLQTIDIDGLDLLEKLLVFSPSQRITAGEALAHPYLQQFSCTEDEPIVLQAFHVEHEVDDLSPKSMRRMISGELQKSVDVCGTRTPDTKQTKTAKVDNSQCQSGVISPRQQDKDLSKAGLIEEERVQEEEGKNTHVDIRVENQKSRANPVPCPERNGKIDLLPLPLLESPSLLEDMKHLQIVVDLPDEENRKEQASPKENKDDGSEKDCDRVNSKFREEQQNMNQQRLLVHIDTAQTRRKPSQKAKDILNEEKRAESPRDSFDFVKERTKNVRKDKKRKKNKHTRNGNNTESQDFDTLYRLPTEHLTRHRNSICGKDKKCVEEQLRLHEEINERRKMVEMEKEKCVGAVGGYVEVEEGLVSGRGRTTTGGNISPVSEHSRDSSPTSDEQNIQRRFEN